MKKVVIHSAGGYDRLRLEDHPLPEPGEGEVCVQCRAVGVNYADCIVRMGLYESAKEYVGWPITPGFEFSGEVSKVGAGVTAWAVGDSAFGVTRFGGYAESVVVPEGQLFPRPGKLSYEAAAGFPAVSLTAWYALRELVRLRPGRRLLVHSAAGGVGGTLVQIGKLSGCEVTGVVGASHKVDVVRSLGADHVIDKSRDNLWEAVERIAPRGFDVVLDANGVETLGQSYEHLASEGKLVCYGFHTMLPRGRGKPNWLALAWNWLRTPRFNPIDLTNSNRSVLAFNLSYLFERTDFLREAMDELLGWVESGELVTPKITTYSLADCAQAHRDLESGQTVGKLVLVVP